MISFKHLLPQLVQCLANNSSSWAPTVAMWTLCCHCVCVRLSYSSLCIYTCGISSGGGWLVDTVLCFESYGKLRVGHYCHWSFQCNGRLPYVSLCYSLLKSTFVGMEYTFQCKNVNLWKPRVRLLLSATWVLSNLLEANQILLGNPPHTHPQALCQRADCQRAGHLQLKLSYGCDCLRSSLDFYRMRWWEDFQVNGWTY